MLGLLGVVAAVIADTIARSLPSTFVFAVVFTALSLFSSQACNPGRTWWRNPGLVTDLCYLVAIPFLAPYMRMCLMLLGATLVSGIVTSQQVIDYFNRGRGPLAALSFWEQVLIYVIVSDFFLYWSHRIFHRTALWRFHAIHHSAEEVDWTTAYRFHPINLWLGPFLVTAIMLYAGVPPAVLLFLVPFDTATAAFVHSNLNWTFGPLRYVLASPIFHRWHHTPLEEVGNRNFGALLSLWDVVFGTFCMPQGQLPSRYGINDSHFPQGFIGQLVEPFRHVRRAETHEAELVTICSRSDLEKASSD
jgi:sterol desaturase/sphingolipid hydroxylase (fatty acid hydroxylase superfamily)